MSEPPPRDRPGNGWWSTRAAGRPATPSDRAREGGGWAARLKAAARSLGASLSRAARGRRPSAGPTPAETGFAHLLDLTGDGVMIGQDRRVVMVNDALARMLGYAPADMPGLPLADLVAPEELDHYRARHLARLEGRDAPTSYDIALRRADGTLLPCHARVAVIDHGGRPAVLCAITDLSAIAGATRQLLAKTGLLEVTFGAMSQGICVLGPDLRFLGGNDRIPGMLGVPVELFSEGKGFIDVARYCAARGDYGPGDTETLAQARLQFLMSSDDGMTLERETHDGRIFDARHAKLPDGGWVITYADVTEERRNMRALAESEERLRQVMDNAVDVILLVNEAGTIEAVNHAARRIFGYEPQELVGRDVIMLMTEEEGLRHAAFMQRYIRRDEPLLVNVAREMQGRHRDGHTLPLEVSSGEFRTGGGRRMFVGLVRDLTERKAIEARLRQSQKLEALGQLTGGVAHDFNNLLAAIMSGVEDAMQDVPPGSETQQSLDIAMRATEQAAGLTQRLLSFARQQELAPARIEPSVVIDQLSGLLRSSVPMAIELVVSASADTTSCVVDRTQFETALLNLVVNARDAIAGAGTIAVSVENRTIDAHQAAGDPALRAGHWVAISVSDTGAGMPSEIRHRIFEPFFTTKGPGKGTGLGLSMVHGFVLQSGGFLVVDSAPERGTAIRMHFPAADGAQAPMATARVA
ncbi:MAG: PAS domain S-box protein [Alphaproteobacteria bacterium]|nr:PAS domain S-box protein [Alphaproteobacteria bacterium]MCW5742819.1 PAS domain S-box protein [Alphaproteobacteria bacterium]